MKLSDCWMYLKSPMHILWLSRYDPFTASNVLLSILFLLIAFFPVFLLFLSLLITLGGTMFILIIRMWITSAIIRFFFFSFSVSHMTYRLNCATSQSYGLIFPTIFYWFLCNHYVIMGVSAISCWSHLFYRWRQVLGDYC